MVLNDQHKWYADFKNDYSKKLLRLLPSAALMSVSPGERVSVNHLAAAPLSTALDIDDTTVLDIDNTALLWANRVLQVTGTPDSETVETAPGA
jgi:hypothetical protein